MAWIKRACLDCELSPAEGDEQSAAVGTGGPANLGTVVFLASMLAPDVLSISSGARAPEGAWRARLGMEPHAEPTGLEAAAVEPSGLAKLGAAVSMASE